MVENEKASSVAAATTEKPKINKLGLVPVFMDIGKFHCGVQMAFLLIILFQALQRYKGV